MPQNRLLLKRGMKADLPAHLPLGEPVVCLDTGELFLGMGMTEPLKPISSSDSQLNDEVKKLIEDFYDHLENHPSGGGGEKPSITSDFPLESQINTDDEVTIEYFFTTPNKGLAHAYYIVDNIETVVEIKKEGKHTIKVGPFAEKGDHTVEIYVIDSAGSYSNNLFFTLSAGSLDLTKLEFQSGDYDYADAQEGLTVDFNFYAKVQDTYQLEVDLDGKITNMPIVIGDNTIKLPALDRRVHTLRLKAFSSTMASNTLEYKIVVIDGDDLFISSEYPTPTQVEVGRNILIDYLISMKQLNKFKAFYTIDGRPAGTDNAIKGTNFWNVGSLDVGDHTLEIVCKTPEEDITSNRLVFDIKVVSVDYVPFDSVTRSCIAHLDGRGHSNSAEDRGVWRSTKITSGASATLHNFNYSSNGWTDDSLKFNGDAYAELDIKPLEGEATNGFTLDILYKVENVGDIEAHVCDCILEDTPYTGIGITTYRANFNSATRKMFTEFSENIWTRQTFVVDRTEGIMAIYTNAVLSKLMFLNRGESFHVPKKLILGARRNAKGEIVNSASCEVKTLRIYNTALDHEEILQNHIADIHDREEQLAIRELNYATDGMPRMDVYDLEGEMENLVKKSDRAKVRIKYKDPKDPTTAFDKSGKTTIQWQGTSSLAYAVKNYKIRLYNDDGSKFKTCPKAHWLPEDTFTLKADYMESSHASNVGTAKFVEDLYDAKLPPQEINPLTRSAIDGFPMQLYIHSKTGEVRYAGIYMFNIDKNAKKCFGFEIENEEGEQAFDCVRSYEVSANSSIGAGAFHDDSWESIRSEFEIRYHPDEDNVIEEVEVDGVVTEFMKEGCHPELVRLISWVKNASQEDFDRDATKYLNIPYCIDYYLTVYTLGMVDNFGKNMMLSTWDGEIWYPTFYDMDTMLGVNNMGFVKYGPDVDMANNEYNTSNSKLWTLLSESPKYKSQIKARYHELRNRGKFSIEGIESVYFGEIINKIGQRYYNTDAYAKYIPYREEYLHMCNGSRQEFTRRWIAERLIYMDSIYDYGHVAKKSTIRVNHVGEANLYITTYSPQWVTVSFSGAQGNTIRKKCSKGEPTKFTGLITSAKDNEIILSNASEIMYIDGIKEMYPEGLLLGEAIKLVEVDCSGSPYLTTLELSKNKLLQKVNCSGCKNLGNQELQGNPKLDLSASIYLKELNCANTMLSVLNFNEKGGALKLLDASNTKITDFSITGQEFLKEIKLDGCKDLSSLSITNCNNLTKVSMPNSKLAKFHVDECNGLEDLDISGTGYLQSLNLAGCPNLKKLNLSGVTNNNIRELDLNYCPNIEELNTSKSDSIEGIRFNINCTSLKKLNVSSSVIKYFRYGVNPAPNYLDLGGFNLSYVNFYNCTMVEDIRNLNLIATGNMAPFYNCTNLRSIQCSPNGKLKLKGSISQGFRNCAKLTTLPNESQIDLSEVTSISECFLGCTQFTLAQVKMLLSKLTNCSDMYNGFSGCTGIVTNDENPIPADLFINNTKVTNLYWTFSGCSNMTGPLPQGLFDKMTELQTFRRPFHRVTGFLPPTLFHKCTKLTNMWDGFHGSQITVVPDKDFFSKCPNLTKVTNIFYGNSTMLGEIPDTLFAKNTKLQEVDGVFNGCSGLVGSIPANLFANCPDLQTVASAFSGCKGLTGSIPANLLKNNRLITLAGSLFYNCSGLTGSIPEDFLQEQINITDMSNMFNGCANLGGVEGATNEIPRMLFRNKRSLDNITGIFKNCAKLQFSLDGDMFRDCVSLTKVAETFYACKGLTGRIPENLFVCYNEEGEEVSTVITSANGMFAYCNRLNGTIPENLFDKFLSVTSLADFFRECHNIEGEIPPNLFKKCYSLISTNHMFYRNYKLGKARTTEEDPYAFDKGLFSACVSLETTNSMFSECNKLIGHISEETFRTNTKLKSTNHMFYGTPISGTLKDLLFANNSALQNVGGMFRGCSSIEGIEPNLFTDRRNPKMNNFQMTFAGCSKMKGTVPTLWNYYPNAERGQCFRGCTPSNITNWDEIGDTWK